MALKVLLDTNAVLLYLGDTADLWSVGANFFVSVVSEIELLSFPGLQTEEEEEIRSLLDEVNLVDLTPVVRAAAIQLRKKHRLKLPNAIITGTALVVGAELWTNDKRLLAIPEITSRPLRIPKSGD